MWIGKKLFLIFFVLDLIREATSSGECGKPVKRQAKIIGGENAKKSEFPFMVSLRGPEEPQAVQILHKCGAVLLNERWLLTAAHCVYEYRRKKFLARLKARLGEHDTSFDGNTHQDISVETLVTHPQYQDPHRQSNDIALLRLSKNAIFNDDVWPVCLPSPRVDITGMNATVAGWGQTNKKPGVGTKKTVLQKVNVPVLSNGACKKMYGEAGQSYPLEENQLCAGYREGGKDSCQGDSGGPLFVSQNGQLTVIGLVSDGIECGSPLLPGVYTRVLSHIDWIRDQIKS